MLDESKFGNNIVKRTMDFIIYDAVSVTKYKTLLYLTPDGHKTCITTLNILLIVWNLHFKVLHTLTDMA